MVRQHGTSVSEMTDRLHPLTSELDSVPRLSRVVRRIRTLAILGFRHLTSAPEEPGLSLTEHHLTRPRFPVIDSHSHLRGTFAHGWENRSAAELATLLDAVGVERIVDLNGEFGARLAAERQRFSSLGERVGVFAGIDYGLIAATDAFGARMADEARRSKDAGAVGLKVWKTLGLHARDGRGRLVGIDDERMDPLWAAAAELDMPVMIHVADPRAFFRKMTRSNERRDELRLHPEWRYWPPRPAGNATHSGFPAHHELIEQFRAVLRRHPAATFIGAHVAGVAEDLKLVGEMLEEHPNLMIDTSARISELGRQPYSARALILRFPERVLFGVDHVDRRAYELSFRFFETHDEYFEYAATRLPQNGRWRIYGLGLPDEVLEQVYRRNALRLIWKVTEPTPAATA
jgi:predicted TIM-barrel fold metal-dependent hydrolase